MASLVVLSCGCGSGIENIGLEVTVEGDRVTIDWDGRPVHNVEVANPSEGYRTYWWVSVADVPVSAMPPRNTEPAIVPPIGYGEPVENAFPTTAQPLVRGNTYDVSVDVL
jgi:hypothetical protein